VEARACISVEGQSGGCLVGAFDEQVAYIFVPKVKMVNLNLSVYTQPITMAQLIELLTCNPNVPGSNPG
jgi:hypothetical protein